MRYIDEGSHYGKNVLLLAPVNLVEGRLDALQTMILRSHSPLEIMVLDFDPGPDGKQVPMYEFGEYRKTA